MHGWLVIHKPAGVTSAHVVNRVKYITQAKKIGHAGTLDPFATGVLPLALGEATKTMPFMLGSDKAYRFTARFGTETDTDDIEGSVVNSTEHIPSKEEILAALPAFTGEISQTPPQYSAVKVDGQRAYALARKGEKVDIKSKEVTIRELSLLSQPAANEAEFFMRCSKGTYVRALVRDLARKLGSFAHTITLERTQAGIFSENDTILLEKLEELVHTARPFGALMPVEKVLDDIPAFPIESETEALLRYGRSVPLTGNVDFKEGSSLWASLDGKAVALGTVKDGNFKPVRVFNH